MMEHMKNMHDNMTKCMNNIEELVKITRQILDELKKQNKPG